MESWNVKWRDKKCADGFTGVDCKLKMEKKEDKKERDRRREGSWQGIEQQENIESAGKEPGKEGNDIGVEAIGEIWR